MISTGHSYVPKLPYNYAYLKSAKFCQTLLRPILISLAATQFPEIIT